MSRIGNASQYDKSYRPRTLGNWEVPDDAKARPSAATSPKHKTADGRTLPIVDERGHLVVKKKPAAFCTELPAHAQSPPRWPQASPTTPAAPAATMGYKGIATGYLPSSTVSLLTVVPGTKALAESKERTFQ